MITIINKAKTLIKHTSCDCKCKFNSITCNPNQKWNSNTCQRKCKKHCMCKKYSWNFRICICENSRYLKSIIDTLVSVCNEIINATDNVTANLTNAILPNMTNTISITVTTTMSTIFILTVKK